MFFYHPRNRGDAAQETTVPGEACAGEDITQGRGQKVVPLFDDEENSRADEPADGGGEYQCRCKLWIIAAALQLQAHDPAGGERRQSHHRTEAVDGYRTELKKNWIHLSSRIVATLLITGKQ